MNILFIENALLPTRGGVERVTYILAEAFRYRGFESHIAFETHDSDCFPESKKCYLPMGKNNAELIYQVLKEYIEKNKIDVIIVQNCYSSIYRKVYWRLKTCFIHLKIIACLHGNPDIWVNKNKWGCTTPKIYFKELARSLKLVFFNPYKDRMKGMYKICDRYILLSEKFIPIFCSLYRIEDTSKLLAIHNPCTFSEAENGMMKKEKIVLIVARMAEQQKRISNALKIWENVCSMHREWKLQIVGDGPDLAYYQRIVSKKGITNVEFIGHSANVEEYYKKAKIFMMTSIWEGLPMTLIEAQHYGCVCIGFDTYASIHDIIDDGENGYIIKRHDINTFGQKLSSLMDNESEWQLMSEKSQNDVNNKFNINLIVNKWENLINNL